MKANVKIAKVYNTILEETKTDLVIEKDNKTYIGALFFEAEEHETITEIIEEQQIEGTPAAIILTAYFMKKKYNLLAKDNKTLQVMAHWQHVNGFSDEMFINSYSCKNDTEFLATFNPGL